MSKQQQPPPPRGNGPKPRYQGERGVPSARRYNEFQAEFVNSMRGRLAIEDTGNVDVGELAELEDAEHGEPHKLDQQ